MCYFRTSAFKKAFKNLSHERQNRVLQALGILETLFEKQENPIGLGLKQLKHGIWEIRSGLKDRVLFRRERDEIQFLTVGDHDDIRRALKNT